MNFGILHKIPTIDPDYCESLKPHVLDDLRQSLLFRARDLIFDGKTHTVSSNISSVQEGNELVVRVSLNVV